MNCNNCGRVVLPGTTDCPCGAKIFFHQPALKAAPTKVERKSPEAVTAELGKITTHKATRSVFRPGESFKDYQDAMHKSGLSQKDFEAKRLVENGWTDEMEKRFRGDAHMCRLGVLPGATPEDISALAVALDPEAIAERAAIQAE